MSYEAEAHREWHLNAGVRSGDFGGTCPWDACGHGWSEVSQEEAEAIFAEQNRPWVALRPGEFKAPCVSWRALGPAAPDPWMDPDAFDPPF